MLTGSPLLSPGRDALNELAISNAAYLSQWQGNIPVELPMDCTAFDRLLAEHQTRSVLKQERTVTETSTGYSKRWQVNW